MNQQLFEQGYAAYQARDWARAAQCFQDCKSANELSGNIDHLRGNCLMKMGLYADAADAYGQALADASYGHVGALNTNRGRALVAAGQLDEAIVALTAATQDPSYATPYKAYMALGSACRATGDMRGAGIAYRNAAIDEANPDPSASLRKLSGCFMDLGRPDDAVETYRTAIDFCTDTQAQNALYCDLALAYMAANRMDEAVDAFEHATADGTYVLTPEAQAAYDAAVNARAARSVERRRSDTDDLIAAAEFGTQGSGSFDLDPLDPTGSTSADLMPSPEDTGFFQLNEEEVLRNERNKKKGSAGRVVAIVIVVLVVLAAASVFAYYNGFGWPTQEAVVERVFDAKTRHDDVGVYISSKLEESDRNQIVAMIPTDAAIRITGVNRSMANSDVTITATLAEGGEQSYQVALVRDGIGWKVSGFEPIYVAASEALTIENTDAAAAEAPADPAAEVPAEQQAEVPAEQPAEAPAEQPAEAAPVEEVPAEQPAEAPVEQPVEEAPAEAAPEA